MTQDTKVRAYFAEASRNFEALQALAPDVGRAADVIGACLKAGGKVLLCGNGGSAADAQHIAAELVGRYRRERAPMAALALTTDTSALTAIANDTGYDQIFARQLQALGKPGDVLVAISTSGTSPSVLEALKVAGSLGLNRIGLTGQSGGNMAADTDLLLCAPSTVTSHIQEMHIAVGHVLCGLLEDSLGDSEV